MIITDLFQKVLLEPADKSTELLIVSGYAKASMADRHLDALIKDIKTEVAISLIYGMASVEGVSLSDHTMFKKLESLAPFKCYYFAEPVPVHSKVYVWLINQTPYRAFVGSANYTQSGFFGNYQYKEVMAEVNPDIALDYYHLILGSALEIMHEDIEERVTFYDPTQSPHTTELTDIEELTLVTRDGTPGKISGLNWGQREGRNRNQAYIPIPSNIAGKGFFPARTERFTVRTDDGFVFIAAVAQDGDKAIHSPESNDIIGKYFRDRLGVGSGAPVTREHLDRYGRTDVTFYKIDDETYYMDFAVYDSE